MKKEKVHNGLISLWKFIFCLVIAIYHGNPFYPKGKIPIFIGGYIGVEFFFLVSGFFFAKSALKGTYKKENIGKETIQFIWKRFKKLLPYIIIIYLMSIIFYFFWVKPPLTTSELVNSIWDLLLLREFGFRSPTINGTVWYISVLFFSMLILYPLLKKHKENFILIASPIIVIISLGYLNRNYLGLDHYYYYWDKYVSTGFIRGFAEINIGLIIYYINQKCKKIDYTIIGKTILTIIPWVLLIAVLAVISFIDKHKEYDYVLLLMIILSIQIMISGKTYDIKLFSNKFIFFLEKISMVIFINHKLFRIIVSNYPKFLNLSPRNCLIVYIILTLLFSIIEYFIIEKMKTINYSKIKNIFIKRKRRLYVKSRNNI